MTGFVINTFSGMVPKLSARLLANNKAHFAENCYFSSGELVPLKALLKIGDNLLPKNGVITSIYRFGEDEDEDKYWFHWADDVDVARGNIVGDTTERTYFTGDGAPKITYAGLATGGSTGEYPTNAYELGVPVPDVSGVSLTVSNLKITSITVTGLIATVVTEKILKLVTGETVDIFDAPEDLFNVKSQEITVINTNTFSFELEEEPVNQYLEGDLTYNYGGLAETRVYGITYVSRSGEEGAPAVTNPITVVAGQEVEIKGMPSVVAGNFDLLKKRIYRTAQGTAQTSLRYVGEVTLANAIFLDTLRGSQLGENIPSLDFVAPPANARCLISIANGMQAVISGNEVCISEPYQYHSYPIAYRYAINEKLIGLGSFGNSIVVLTNGTPTVLTGSSPEAMSQDEVKIGQPCLSKRSIVELLGGVMWASDEGLAFISSGGFEVPTKDLFDVRSWKKYNPNSIHAYRWENKYIGFYDNGLEQRGFMFDPLTMDWQELGFYATAGFTNTNNGDLYLAIGHDIYKFDAGTAALIAKYRTRVFVSTKPINMAYYKISASQYPVTMSFYADGSLKHYVTVNDDKVRALPRGYKATEFQVLLETAGVVQGFAFAETAIELTGSLE